ncbi:MAG: ATP-dependent helicase, partial [Proteobacteria bacterium]|nr:ATP-dependent helicase [Pseudomonadota bacterium]
MFSDTSTDIEIKECIEARQSFSVVAGAGSGKTRSLIKALFFVRKTKGVTLNTNAQKVVCITYTNSAVDVIQRRLDQDPLFKVSTIHSFIWGEIARFQSEIRSQLAVKLLPQRIEKKQEEDNGGNSRTAINARKRVARLQTALDNLNSVECFVYDEKGGRNYSEGRLDHDDIIDLGTLMILNLPILRKILGQKYPFIFIDESQDTFPQIVEALNEISNSEKLPVIGYFGDPMQQIYENRAGEINGPTNSKVIKKEENYRCSEAVIKLLNSFRKDIQQKPAGNNAEGSVELLLIKAEPGEGPRKSYTDKQIGAALLKFDKALDDFGWSDDNEVKRLFLTRQ